MVNIVAPKDKAEAISNAEEVLGRPVTNTEIEFLSRAWPIIQMHRDLSLDLPLEQVRERCLKCASAIYIMLVRGSKAWVDDKPKDNADVAQG